MIIRYYGHSLFTFTLENGYTVLTDPYGSFYTYPKQTLRADVVTVSHHHHDHDAVSMVTGQPTVLETQGIFTPARGVVITGILSKHDAANGAQRGDNLIFTIEAEGLRLTHLGDLGHVLSAAQRRAIGTPDVLFTPVGGVYTTDAQAAYENVALLNPRVAVPMHYRTAYSAEMPIQTEKPFLALMNAAPEPMAVCRLTKQDLCERPPVILMAVTTQGGEQTT